MAALNDELLYHHIATIKRGAGLGNQVEPYLAEMKAIISKQAAGFDFEKRTAKRLEKLIETLANKLAIPARAVAQGAGEGDQGLRAVRGQVPDRNHIRLVNVEMTADADPGMGGGSIPAVGAGRYAYRLHQALDDWGVDEVNRLTMAVKSGFVRGQTVNQIIKEVVGVGGLADISLRNAKTIAQTSIMHVWQTKRMLTYEENDDYLTSAMSLS